jgi:hypothetical protein
MTIPKHLQPAALSKEIDGEILWYKEESGNILTTRFQHKFVHIFWFYVLTAFETSVGAVILLRL